MKGLHVNSRANHFLLQKWLSGGGGQGGGEGPEQPRGGAVRAVTPEMAQAQLSSALDVTAGFRGLLRNHDHKEAMEDALRRLEFTAVEKAGIEAANMSSGDILALVKTLKDNLLP